MPPLRKLANLVMSSLPLGFLASWQPKQFSLRMGATSLMKLTGPLGGRLGGAGRPRREQEQRQGQGGPQRDAQDAGERYAIVA